MSERRYCPACTPKVREAIKEVSTCRLETNHYERKRADEKIASIESDLARLREIERAAREVVGGADDECHVCLEWGHCPRCTGNPETATREKCDRCELRVALSLPCVVNTQCDTCESWGPVKARKADNGWRLWACEACRTALEKGKEVGR